MRRAGAQQERDAAESSSRRGELVAQGQTRQQALRAEMNELRELLDDVIPRLQTIRTSLGRLTNEEPPAAFSRLLEELNDFHSLARRIKDSVEQIRTSGNLV